MSHPTRDHFRKLSLIRQRAIHMDIITRYAASEASCAWNLMVFAGHAVARIEAQLVELEGGVQ